MDRRTGGAYCICCWILHALTGKQYQELFSVCQAFSGPGSTKMHYCINLIHDGFLPAALSFLIWR